METRGNYILIGLFTIAGLVAALVFFLAFARLELDRQFSYYDIRFQSVSGLGEASDVRFAGLPVGQVVDVSLSQDLDGSVTVRIEVDAQTPVRANSVATVESQGVTGVGFVAISAGTPGAELARAGVGEVGEITAGRSIIQSLSEDAPALVTETLGLVRNVSEIFSGENRDRIEQIILNAESASQAFSSTLEDFAGVAGSVDEFVTQIDRFNAVLQTLAADFDTVLITADEVLSAWGDTATEAQDFLISGTDAFESAETALGSAQVYIDEDLVAATTQLRETVATLQGQIEGLSQNANSMIGTFSDTGALANARLTEVAETLVALDALIANSELAVAAVETASADFSTLVTEDGAALVAETRAVVATTQAAMEAIRTEAETTLPAILGEVSSAAATVSEMADQVSSDLTGASGLVDDMAANINTALIQASQTFANADVTLSAINEALSTGEDTLRAATGAFTSAEGAIEEELAPMIARLRETLDGLDVAVAQVSADLPGISTSLSEASTAAEDAFEGISAAVRAASPAIQDFAASGLPEYAQFARDARALTDTLDRLIRQIERDPGRFFLGSDTPEFRR